MKRAAIYDKATGRIVQTVSGSPRSLDAMRATVADGMGWLEVKGPDSLRGKRVENGRLVDAEPDRDAALRALRIERAQRLSEHVDKFTPLRIEGLSPPQLAALKRYRQALLDITKGDPLAPDWPDKPDFI